MTKLAAYRVRLLSVNLYGNKETYMWTLSLATGQFSPTHFTIHILTVIATALYWRIPSAY